MDLTAPGPTLGVVGGGQLGRMLGEAAGPLGVDLVVSDPTPDCPASPVVRDQLVGGFEDYDTLHGLAERADVLTYEIELADPDVLERVSHETGIPVHPAPDTLRTIQDKLVQKRTLVDAGIPVPEFRRVDDVEDLRAAGTALDWPVMLKAREGGYDGRGNIPVEGPDEAADALATIEGDAMAERMIDFDRELAVMAVQGDDEHEVFAVTETVHRDEILRESVTPARTDAATRKQAREVALDVLAELDGRGAFGVELFEADGEILVNEIAPRPHNSGHWTIEGAAVSQFENHVRAVLGWPLGTTTLRCPTVTTNLLADVDQPTTARLRGVEDVLADDHAHLHWYRKREARPLRKMGHVTFAERGADPTDLLAHARTVRDSTTFVEE